MIVDYETVNYDIVNCDYDENAVIVYIIEEMYINVILSYFCVKVLKQNIVIII